MTSSKPGHAGDCGLPRAERLDGPPERIVLHHAAMGMAAVRHLPLCGRNSGSERVQHFSRRQGRQGPATREPLPTAIRLAASNPRQPRPMPGPWRHLRSLAGAWAPTAAVPRWLGRCMTSPRAARDHAPQHSGGSGRPFLQGGPDLHDHVARRRAGPGRQGFAEISWNKPSASAASRNTAAATATRSRLTLRCQNLAGQEPAIGEVLALLAGDGATQQPTGAGPPGQGERDGDLPARRGGRTSGS
jgi:hypothetical protein